MGAEGGWSRPATGGRLAGLGGRGAPTLIEGAIVGFIEGAIVGAESPVDDVAGTRRRDLEGGAGLDEQGPQQVVGQCGHVQASSVWSRVASSASAAMPGSSPSRRRAS